MKLAEFPFFDQLGEYPIQVDIEKHDALFREGVETAGAYFLSSSVVEIRWLRENENFNSGFEFTKNTEQSVESVFWGSKVLRKQKSQRDRSLYSAPRYERNILMG